MEPNHQLNINSWTLYISCNNAGCKVVTNIRPITQSPPLFFEGCHVWWQYFWYQNQQEASNLGIIVGSFPSSYCDTVDGRNPAPVDMRHFPLFAGFYTSQAMQDFFHQQYVSFFQLDIVTDDFQEVTVRLFRF